MFGAEPAVAGGVVGAGAVLVGSADLQGCTLGRGQGGGDVADLSLFISLVREFRAVDRLEECLLVSGDRGGEGLGRAVDRDGR